jgi:beta-lactamase regulating signal transducer with metallopeptidase domain
MTEISAWFASGGMRLLAWVLLHFLWQGLVLAAVFAALMTAVREAAMRYAIAVSILVLMAAAPVATFLFLQEFSSHQPAAVASVVSTPLAEAPPVHEAIPHSKATGDISPDTFLWLVRIWMAGVIFFSLRTAGGMLLVERLQRSKASPPSARLLATCLDLQRRVGITRTIRFCQCNGLDVPAVIGWFRPVVLLPMTVLTGLSHAQLEAVIVHELAHIKRGDYFVNLFQIAVETLLFYHPAVWWVSGRIRVERENCCDDTAVWLCGNAVDYARALTYMEGGRTAPSLLLAASGSPLAQRVMRLLGANKSSRSLLSVGITIGSLCLAAGVFMSQAFVRIAHADSTSNAAPVVAAKTPVAPKLAAAPKSAVAAKPEAAATAAVAPVPAASPRASAAPAVAVAHLLPTPAVAPTPAVMPVPAFSFAFVQQTDTSTQVVTKTSYIDSLKAEGLDHLSADELVAMKIQGVTADYVREIHSLGLKPGADELIAMRIQGVTPDYVRGMKSDGITASVDELVAMRIQGVTPEYVRGMKDLGLKASAEELVAMRIQQVTPKYVRDIRALGLNPTIEELIAMRIQGVTPAYIKGLSAAGISKLSTDEYVAAKIQGITPEFVEKARQHGFNNLDLDRLMALKNAGVL